MIWITLIRIVIWLTFFLLIIFAVVSIIFLPRFWKIYVRGHLDHETRILALEQKRRSITEEGPQQ
jgi:hypothetical protein